MKDDKLEKQFEEYFTGVNIPDDITADAKKSVSKKRIIMPKIVKFASIAASIVLVFAVAFALMFRTGFKASSPEKDMANGGNSSNAESPGNADSDGSGSAGGDMAGNSGSGDSRPDHSTGEGDPSAPDSPGGGSDDGEADGPDGAGRFTLYGDSDITLTDASAYTLSSIHSSLKFLEELADNVEDCKVAHMNGTLVLVKAKIDNYDVTDETCDVFVEFTDKDVVYRGLSVYFDGDTHYYNDVKYYLTQTAKEGAFESKLLILSGGVKYYFNIRSSDKNAYKNYLKLIIN